MGATTDIRLAEIRARLKEATPGPWVIGSYRGMNGYDIETADGRDLSGIHRGMVDGRRNAELIAHAPADLAYLLDRVDRLENAVKALLDVTFDERKATAEFDRFNYAYLMETGYQRPGKDDPEYDTNSPENRKRFSEWARDRTGKAIDLARGALEVTDDD